MSETVSERRMAENEVVFREYNEKIQNGFDEIKKIAKEDGQAHNLSDEDMSLDFCCECWDENCQEKIRLKPSDYKAIQVQRNQFVVISGHETSAIERVIENEANYAVVQKFETPPSSVDSLNKT
jgi:hypothetical protein